MPRPRKPTLSCSCNKARCGKCGVCSECGACVCTGGPRKRSAELAALRQDVADTHPLATRRLAYENALPRLREDDDDLDPYWLDGPPLGRPADDNVTMLRAVCDALQVPLAGRSIAMLPASRHTESFCNISARGRREARRVGTLIVTKLMETLCPRDPLGLWKAVDGHAFQSDGDRRAGRIRNGAERALRMTAQALSQLPNCCQERDVLASRLAPGCRQRTSST